MSKREDAKLAKLLKKVAGKVTPPRKDRDAQYDTTLRQRPPEQDNETTRLFKDMKKREF